MKRTPLHRFTPLRRKARRAVDTAVACEVLDRDRGCVAHRRDFALDVPCSGRPHLHHVVLRSHGGSHDASNLITLCEGHHALAHFVRRSDAERSGIIARSADARPLESEA